ncbi:hypothetical protein ACFC5Z_23655 [Streptomyces sp. NPDC056004]|uniref:hypothetical protein n=1 Tax=Streptomyces sp. NPDC056004 TaxID=3345677 RepID=UPI0035E2BE08
MDQGDAAVWGAGIGAVGALFGAVGGYLAGRAQAKAVERGVHLQLDGERETAIWQARVDAYAALVEALNTARMQIGQYVALLSMSRAEAGRLNGFGYGTREEAAGAMTEAVKACVFQETVLRLRVPPEEAEAARNVNESLTQVVQVAMPWGIARTGGPGDAAALKAQVDQRMESFRNALDAFVEDVQGRLARPRTT